MTSDHSTDIRQQIKDSMAHLEHVLPGQAPIKDFVHHNTIHGYQHLPFQEAVAAAYKASGNSGYLPDEAFRKLHQEGRITTEHLLQVLVEDESLDADAVVFQSGYGPVRKQDLYLLALTTPLEPVTTCQLNWQIEEMDAFRRVQADVDTEPKRRLLETAGTRDEETAVNDLWQTCLQSLGLEHYALHPEDLVEVSLDESGPAPGDTPDTQHLQRLIQKDAAKRLKQLLEDVGDNISLRSLIKSLTGTDLMDETLPIMIRRMAAFLDQGMASWSTPGRDTGFYHAWREGASKDPAWIIDSIPEWQDHLESLPDDALETIIAELIRMDLPRERWVRYLEIKALELPGWSGMFLWRHLHPGYEDQAFPVKMLDYLAVRMVLERLVAQRVCRDVWQIEPSLKTLRGYFHANPDELLVRYSLFNSRLPEYLTSKAQKLVNNQPSLLTRQDWQQMAQAIWTWQQSPSADRPAGYSVFRSGWRLFRLAQHLGLCAGDIHQLDEQQLQNIFDCIDELDAGQRGFIWLQAYELQYRDELFAAVAANHQRGRWHQRDESISAQLVFCMDDREEGTRRHLEEIDSGIETLGAAAHFGVPNLWCGLDSEKPVPLTPVVYEPVNLIHEQARSGQDGKLAQHRKRRQLRFTIGNLMHQEIRRNLVSSTMLIAASAPAALLTLVGKLLAPLATGRLGRKLREDYDLGISTSIDPTAAADADPAPTPAHPRPGFTDDEQLQRVAPFLQNLGLTSGFAPLVVFLGHGSNSQNNPHLAAYDCGACSGRHSGPNARIFCAMVNRPQIRQRLAEEYDIHIPDSTWFMGAEHNTCSEEITWYDLDLLPDRLGSNYQALSQSLAEARLRHAHERCRKFASAPTDPTPGQALDHIIGRSYDFTQARPELGHATNAAAIIGRRTLSQGAFFDRRVFLISYDYRIDPEGEILERLLLANGPVGAGISLEYYFSTVDNENYGAGTKIMHNVTGMLGVMEGTSSDLKTGLPRQMIEIHEAMRLQVMCEATTDMLTKIYLRQPPLQELIGNGWLLVSAKDPETGEISVFNPKTGWIPWHGDPDSIATTDCSADWYQGHMEALSPALIQSPEEAVHG